jgi:hypothetical protein
VTGQLTAARFAAVVVVLLLAAGVTTAVVRHGSPSRPQAAPVPHPGGHSDPSTPAVAVAALLDRRAAAIAHHDRAAFASTLDPAGAPFRRSQLAMFGNLAAVRFASWSYEIGRGAQQRIRADRYAVPTYAPPSVTVRYRLAGVSADPVAEVQYPTFVQRSGRWYLASLSDFRARGEISATGLWDDGPVAVVRRSSVLVLGAPAQRRRLVEIAAVMRAAIPRVTAVWGSSWSRRVEVLVPTTEREMRQVDGDVGDHSDLTQIAAQTGSDGLVTINPGIWPELGALGRSVVLTHELTHVATASVSGPRTPRWLEEGFADYVGFGQAGVTADNAAAELAAAVRAGNLPGTLPSDRGFRWSGARLADAYEQAWLACRYIAVRVGQAGLVRFYRMVGTSRQGMTAAVATAMRTVLGLTTHQFTVGWRAYVQRELAG